MDMDEFKGYLYQKDLAPRTIKRHLWYITYILSSCPNFTFQEIDSFLANLKEKGLKNTYTNHFVPTIRWYADFKGLEGFRDHYKYHKEEVYIKATMSDEEIETFLNVPCPKGKVSADWYRYTVFYSIMAYCGLRPSEVAALRADNIDLGQRIIQITQGKTPGSIGNIPIPPNITSLLQSYLDNLTTEMLFPPRRGAKANFGIIAPSTWGNSFHRRLEIIGLKRKNLSVYSLRHSYCTSLLSNEVNVFDAKRLMRHTDLKTTEHYYHYTMENLRKAQNKHPLIRRNTHPKQILTSLTEVIKSFHIEKDDRFKYELVEDGTRIKFECNIVEE